MQNDPRSHGLWEMTAPAAPATQTFSGTADADVVIVGGGFTGFSAALHLAERGTDYDAGAGSLNAARDGRAGRFVRRCDAEQVNRWPA